MHSSNAQANAPVTESPRCRCRCQCNAERILPSSGHCPLDRQCLPSCRGRTSDMHRSRGVPCEGDQQAGRRRATLRQAHSSAPQSSVKIGIACCSCVSGQCRSLRPHLRSTHDDAVVVPLLVPPDFLAFAETSPAEVEIVADERWLAAGRSLGIDLSATDADCVRDVCRACIAGVLYAGLGC